MTSSLKEVVLWRSNFFSVQLWRSFVLCYVCCPVTMCFRVKEALAAEPRGSGQGQKDHLSSFLPLINTCVIPSLLRCVYIWLCVCLYCIGVVCWVIFSHYIAIQSYDIIMLRVMTCEPLLTSSLGILQNLREMLKL